MKTLIDKRIFKCYRGKSYVIYIENKNPSGGLFLG